MCYSALVKRDLKKYGGILVREQIDDYRRQSAADPKRYPALEPRIFPGHYAPAVAEREGERVVELMRYGAHPPPSLAGAKAYTTFNARRDNLTSSFWSSAFMQHHGFVVLEAFYEWVSVADLLTAGVVTLAQVKAEFARQAEERRAKILAAGKKYKPTPTEGKDPRERKIIIEFRPDDGRDLVVPIIFNFAKTPDDRWDPGFAIITDEPTPEIRAAGHDRCPVILEPDAVGAWLSFAGKSAAQVDEVLAHRQRLTFRHGLAEAA